MRGIDYSKVFSRAPFHNGGGITWRVLNWHIHPHYPDYLMYVNYSRMLLAMYDARLSAVQMEDIFQNLGINIIDWQIVLALKVLLEDKTYKGLPKEFNQTEPILDE